MWRIEYYKWKWQFWRDQDVFRDYLVSCMDCLNPGTEVTSKQWEWTQKEQVLKKQCRGLKLQLNLMEKFTVCEGYHNFSLFAKTAANIYQTTRSLDTGVLIFRLLSPHYLSTPENTRLCREIKAIVTRMLNSPLNKKQNLTINTVVLIEHLPAYYKCQSSLIARTWLWASHFVTLMQGEIANLTKDAWLWRVFESDGGKPPKSYPNPLTNWDLVEMDQLTFEEINILKNNDIMSLQEGLIKISKD